jgi:hypothetical protein
MILLFDSFSHPESKILISFYAARIPLLVVWVAGSIVAITFGYNPHKILSTCVELAISAALDLVIVVLFIWFVVSIIRASKALGRQPYILTRYYENIQVENRHRQLEFRLTFFLTLIMVFYSVFQGVFPLIVFDYSEFLINFQTPRLVSQVVIWWHIYMLCYVHLPPTATFNLRKWFKKDETVMWEGFRTFLLNESDLVRLSKKQTRNSKLIRYEPVFCMDIALKLFEASWEVHISGISC